MGVEALNAERLTEIDGIGSLFAATQQRGDLGVERLGIFRGRAVVLDDVVDLGPRRADRAVTEDVLRARSPEVVADAMARVEVRHSVLRHDAAGGPEDRHVAAGLNRSSSPQVSLHPAGVSKTTHHTVYAPAGRLLVWMFACIQSLPRFNVAKPSLVGG